MKVTPIATNLIGSFPLENTPQSFARAIDDQVSAGLDYVSCPQLSDMNLMFLEPLVEEGALHREGSSFTVPQDFEPRLTGPVVSWVEEARDHLRRATGNVPLKSCVTGPFTLLSRLQVEGLGHRPFPAGYADIIVHDSWVLERMAKYVRRICRRYSTITSMVSVDEPFLSVIVGSRRNLLELNMSRAQASDIVEETLEQCLGGIGSLSCIHACGAIGKPLAEMLLGTSVNIISHEFSEMARNFESYAPDDLESNGKILSVGVVSTKPTTDQGGSEPVERVEKRMEAAITRYGADNVIFSPDCGFRPLGDLLGMEKGYALTLRKMQNLTRARRNVAMRLGLLTAETR